MQQPTPDVWDRHTSLVTIMTSSKVDIAPTDYILVTTVGKDALLRAELENDIGGSTKVVEHNSTFYVVGA